MLDKCLFCDKNNSKEHTILCEDNLSYVRWDNFPVSDGHIEVVPIEHVESFFDLGSNQIDSIYKNMKKAKIIIDKKYSPAGYTIGINDGVAAGRTIHHLHIHLIPRYEGDVKNPRGGVRHIISEKGNY